MSKRVLRHAVEQPQDQSIKLIPLTRGHNAIVSSEDYDRLICWNWHARFCSGKLYAYRTETISGKIWAVAMHRMVLNVSNDDPTHVDHINGSTLDNRSVNLRRATCSQNHANRKMGKNNTSGYKGVYWCPGPKLWRAEIKKDQKKVSCGYFKKAELASLAYNKKAVELFGPFAHITSP